MDFFKSSGSSVEMCDFKPGDTIDHRWKVETVIGEGTFGRVFKVSGKDGKIYALKLLKLWEIPADERPNLLKRFDREYETGLIKSLYLVRSISKGTVKGNAYFVMEYCAGGDLLQATSRTSINLSIIGSHVLMGLRDLHLNGKVHRDLKPGNVLLRTDTEAVLTDFGISGDQNNRMTQRGLMGIPKERFGTIAYMPPEQINPKRGNATVLPTTDIYSFGVLMYQLLTGILPFGPLDSEADVPRYVYNGKMGKWDRELLSKYPGADAWLPLLEGCLDPDFKTRLQTVDDVLTLVPGRPADKGLPKHNPIFNRDTSQGMILRVMQGEEYGRVYNLNDYIKDGNSIVYVGRESVQVGNHIPLVERESCYVSRRHCTLEHDAQSRRWIIRDGQWRSECGLAMCHGDAHFCKKCTARCPDPRPPFKWNFSLNGTFVNSIEIDAGGVFINPGDIISIGEVKLRVEGA